MVVPAALERVGGALAAAARSPRRAIATLASADLLAHAVARISASGDGLLFLSTATTLLFELAPFETLGWALGWTLYGYVLFETAHRLLPAVSEAAVDDRLRALLAAATLSVAVVVERSAFRPAVTGSPVPAPPGGASGVALVAVALVAAAGFLLWYDGYPLPTDGLTAALVRSLLWSVAEAIPNPEPSRGIRAVTRLAVGAATLAAVCGLLGVLAVLVSLFFPVPELLLLGWVVVSLVESRSPFSPRRLVPSKSAFDLETRLVVAGAVAGHGLKGLAVVATVVVGLATTLFVFLFFGGLSAALVAGAGELDRLSPRHWVLLVTVLVAFLTYAVFSLWYWLRLLDRAPAFLRRWTASVPAEVPAPSLDSGRPLVTRPPGYHLPASLLFVATMALVDSANAASPRLVRPLSAVVVASFLGVVWSMWLGVRRDPQPPTAGGHAYPISLAVQLAGMALFADVVTGGSVVAGAAALSPSRVLAGLLAADGPTVAALSLPVLFYAPEAVVALEHPPWHRRAVAYSLALGAVLALIGLAGERPLFVAGGLVSPLWAVVYVAWRRLD